jgi:hypothetical protein
MSASLEVEHQRAIRAAQHQPSQPTACTSFTEFTSDIYIEEVYLDAPKGISRGGR